MCKDVSPEQQQRSASHVLEKPETPQIKEEPEDLLQILEEADGSTVLLLTVKSEDDENRDTEPHASISPEHMKTQTDVEDCGKSPPISEEQLFSSHCSDSDITDDSDEWEETREHKAAINKVKSQKTKVVEGQRLPLIKTLSQDQRSSKQTPSRSSKEKKIYCCTVCGKDCHQKSNLELHMRTHTGEKPYVCTVCEYRCIEKGGLKKHMRTHTGEKPYSCTVCKKTIQSK